MYDTNFDEFERLAIDFNKKNVEKFKFHKNFYKSFEWENSIFVDKIKLFWMSVGEFANFWSFVAKTV